MRTNLSIPAIAITLSLPCLGTAQNIDEEHPELRVMKHYAPILWLAFDEPLVPTLPHAFAFDGIGEDLESPEEISWDFDATLEQAVKTIDAHNKRHGLQARVLYYPPSLVRQVDAPPFIYVLEYWFYYLYDRGVGGHKGDSEHAFVFVAVDDRLPEDDPTFSGLLEGYVIGIVGAGHERHTANNVLVASRETRPKEEIYPTELPQHIGILVERGKHGSAPDRDLNGRFDIGADANVFRDGSWGSRDVRADSVGRLFGPFKSWYSFPRHEARILVERDVFTEVASSPPYSTDGGSTHPDPAYYRGYAESYPRLFPAEGTPLVPNEGRNRYTLFPLRDLELLYQILGDEALSHGARVRSTEALLAEHRDCFWLDGRPGPISIPERSMREMQRWPDEKEFNHGNAHHVKLLEHPDHENPDDIFKLHLYPTVAPGFRYKKDGTANQLGELSVRISDIDEKILRNSMVEVNVSWDFANNRLYDIEGQYWFFRGAYSGLYAGLNLRKEHLAATTGLSDDELNALVADVGGAPPLLEASDRWRLGTDVGWAINFNVRRQFFLDVKLGLRSDIFTEGPSDFEIARGAQDKFRFVFGIAARWGIGHPKHPLSY